MYIHRGFFAKALIDHPSDPCLSQYAHSYLSAYRAALSILRLIREYYSQFPNLMGRFWSFWTHAFSATVRIFLNISHLSNTVAVMNAKRVPGYHWFYRCKEQKP